MGCHCMSYPATPRFATICGEGFPRVALDGSSVGKGSSIIDFELKTNAKNAG